jgi:hypothetical protein
MLRLKWIGTGIGLYFRLGLALMVNGCHIWAAGVWNGVMLILWTLPLILMLVILMWLMRAL